MSPRWVDDCVQQYINKGFSEDEAWKRCKGAQKNQQRAKKTKKKTK